MAEVILTPEAELDFQAATAWYMLRGADARFVADVERLQEFLSDFPEAGTACDPRHRYFPMRRFPYGFIYRYEGGRVIVVAVTHNRRLPGYWLGRI